ncbi:sensor histidine kinase [Acinetobacter bouvetii]|uniref:histidine kinase n=1 Tax=Acinetobacter bouvetii TaxID=202951 RepID=A0A811GE58_9GAMM|nr:ATP-binding protein [Acinetobacter bouvetii]CAB1222824.1 Sensor protein QseC [Acinetobacter bouvetii]
MVQSQYSLKKRLIIYISVFSIALGCLLIFSAYRIALQEINEVLDAQMQNLAERIAQHDPEPVQSRFEQAKHYHEEDLFVDVWAYAKEEHKTHAINLLVNPVKKAGFYTHKTSQGVWHTYVLPLEHYQVQVSQQQETRQRLALELAGSMFIPYLLFMPCVIWGLSWIISRSLQPLDDFKAELAQRDSNELRAIQLNDYPVEIVPTITEMNHLFERISSAQQEQRQFIADAAHELRTPITALNLQMQILLKQFPEDQDLQNLSKGLIRIQHLVSQLLNLAKQDASVLEAENKQQFLLNQVAVNCVEQLIHLAMQKNIDLGMEHQEDVLLHSQESSVHSIIYNLIDNAIKYTPNQGVINVSVFERDGLAMIQVEDSGPGIAPELYEKILKRFYRVHHHLEIGSGLGLSIVEKATERLGGKISFSKSLGLGGLQVNVQLPL